MGREIRRVPAGWEHPREADRRTGREEFKPLHDQGYQEACRDWWEAAVAWHTRPPDPGDEGRRVTYRWYWEYEGGPPDKEFHRPDWDEAEMTCYQIYETVSEGTPRSPVFASEAELIDWMVQPVDRVRWPEYNRGEDWQSSQGVTREQAERFVRAGSACSSVVAGGVVTPGHRL